MSKRTAINPSAVFVPQAPLSAGIRADDVAYVSGQVPTDSHGKTVGVGDVREQTRQVLENIKAIVEAAGGTLSDVVKTTVYLPDLDEYAGMNEVYAQYFPTDPPARATIRAELLNREFLLEIEAVAILADR